jgi:hypothetical protein
MVTDSGSLFLRYDVESLMTLWNDITTENPR